MKSEWEHSSNNSAAATTRERIMKRRKEWKAGKTAAAIFRLESPPPRKLYSILSWVKHFFRLLRRYIKFPQASCTLFFFFSFARCFVCRYIIDIPFVHAGFLCLLLNINCRSRYVFTFLPVSGVAGIRFFISFRRYEEIFEAFELLFGDKTHDENEINEDEIAWNSIKCCLLWEWIPFRKSVEQ